MAKKEHGPRPCPPQVTGHFFPFRVMLKSPQYFFRRMGGRSESHLQFRWLPFTVIVRRLDSLSEHSNSSSVSGVPPVQGILQDFGQKSLTFLPFGSGRSHRNAVRDADLVTTHEQGCPIPGLADRTKSSSSSHLSAGKVGDPVGLSMGGSVTLQSTPQVCGQ